jgi:Family of unknown function (DUF6328)
MGRADEDRRDTESEQQRIDRNFDELLQELRVAQTGVQLLFAFLLTVPFSARFEAISHQQRALLLAVLVLAASSAACLISPVALHRALFRRRRRPELVRYADRAARAGLLLLMLAMIGSIWLVTSVTLGPGPTAVLTGLVAAVFVSLWIVLPVWLRVSVQRSPEPPG